MRKWVISLIAAAPLVAVAQPAPAPAPTTSPATQAVEPNKVVLSIGDEKITAAQFDLFLSALPEHIQSQANQPRIRRMIAEQYVNMKLLSNAAIAAGMDKDPKIKEQLKLAEMGALANAYAESASKPSDDSALRAEYEKNKAKYDTVTARHILIRAKGSPAPVAPGKAELSEDQAKKKAEDLRNEIVAGKKAFADVAKAESDDTGSGSRGGELGSFGKGQMVSPFEDAAFGLKIGEVSQPVKTIFGYHLIQVQEHKTPSFEEVKQNMKEQGPEQAAQQMNRVVEELKKDKKLTMDESYFGPAMVKPAGHP